MHGYAWSVRSNAPLNPADQAGGNSPQEPPQRKIYRAGPLQAAAGASLLLRAQEIGLEARVAVFVGPQGKRNRRQIIDQGDGMAIFGQVNGAEIEFAGIASFHANVRELFRDVDRQLVLGFLTARGAQNPAKLPFLQTKGADQESLAAVALRPQDAQKRARLAQRTHPRCHHDGGPRKLCRAEFRAGLEKRSEERRVGKECRSRWSPYH